MSLDKWMSLLYYSSSIVVAKVNDVLAKMFRKHDSRRAESRNKHRGGEPYYCPKGWTRYGVYVPDFDAKWNGTHVCYHGTRSAHATGILETGLVYRHMPGTGDRWDIGPYPAWTTEYLLTGAPATYRRILHADGVSLDAHELHTYMHRLPLPFRDCDWPRPRRW